MAQDDYLIKIQLQIQNDKALKALTDNLQRAAKEAPSAAKKIEAGMNSASKATSNFGNKAQNVGYQIQDLAVQIQGGVSPVKALSQQLPQMLVGFGAWGAAIGVVTALLPALISVIGGTKEEVISLEDAMTDLNSATSKLTNIATAIDFNTWNEQWNKASASVKKAEISILEFRTTVASNSLKDAMAAFADEGGAGAAATTFDRISAAIISFLPGASEYLGTAKELEEQFGRDNLADHLGVSEGTADQIRDVFAQFKSGKIDVTAFRDSLIELSGPNATKGFSALIEQLIEIEKAQQDIANTRKQIADANKALASGGSISVKDKGKQKTADDLRYVSARGKQIDPYGKMQEEELKKTQELYKQLYPDVVKYAEATEMLNDAKHRGILTEEEYTKRLGEATKAFEKSQEQWSIGSELMSTFDKSFNTMLDGVLMGTQDLKEGVEDMVKVIIAQFLKLMAYQAVFSAFGINLGLPAGATANAKGNVFSGGNVVPFAKGGIVNRPTVFPMKNGMGLMGEAGPEAIMPLSRGANGKLGVSAAPMNVIINNNAPGVAVKTRQSEGGLTIDVVMQQVANAVAKGGNPIANALESSYSLGRGRAVY